MGDGDKDWDWGREDDPQQNCVVEKGWRPQAALRAPQWSRPPQHPAPSVAESWAVLQLALKSPHHSW